MNVETNAMVEKKKARISSHRDLDVYQLAFDLAMRIFELTKTFPKEEKFSLVDQIRRSSRSACSNIAEAFHKRRYPAAFVSKLSDADAEAAETEVWVEFARTCGYLGDDEARDLSTKCHFVMGKLVKMMQSPEDWRV